MLLGWFWFGVIRPAKAVPYCRNLYVATICLDFVRTGTIPHRSCLTFPWRWLSVGAVSAGRLGLALQDHALQKH